MKTNRRAILLLTLLVFFVLVFNRCLVEKKTVDSDPRGAGYAGSEKCGNCHREIVTSYQTTAHALTSSAATKNTIRGSFAQDSNSFVYRPDLKILMEKDDSGFYQTAYQDGVKRKTARFDIVTGSGRKGQSYLYWHNDKLYQLPVSYNAAGNNWINSPGFPPHNVQYTRNIPIGCFACHGSFIKKTGSEFSGYNEIDRFEKVTMIYGIDCERCHGGAREHQNFHENNPLEKKAMYIKNIAKLNRQSQVELCAVCHAGAAEINDPGFNFMPGTKLSQYIKEDSSLINPADIDVHGKQYQSLKASKCFQNSAVLTCSSCHNTHKTERQNMKMFSSSCVSCHTTVDHSNLNLPKKSAESLVDNCIDCHMPARPSRLITMQGQDAATSSPAYVRTHFIAIYPSDTLKKNKR